MRSDILVSVAIVDEAGPAATLPRIGALIRALAETYRYFEVIYVLSEDARPELEPLAGALFHLTNLRIIFTSEGTRFYWRRLIGVSEAIGDVVAVLDPEELSAQSLCRHLGEAKDAHTVMIGRRPGRLATSWTYALLSLVSRNVISSKTARTIILPRELVPTILSRRSAALDLRFEPRMTLSRYLAFDIDGRGGRRQGGRSGLVNRYELLLEILLSGVPRFLKAYAAAGFVVMTSALFYLIYALALLTFRVHLQEGWFSTAVTQAGSTAFIAGGMSMLSIALIAIYEHQHSGGDRVIVDEISNTNYFEKTSDRNVELTDSAREESSTA